MGTEKIKISFSCNNTKLSEPGACDKPRFAAVRGIDVSKAVIDKLKDTKYLEPENVQMFLNDNYFKIKYDEGTGIITLVDVTTQDDPDAHTFKFNYATK